MTWGTWSYGDVVVRSETLMGARWIAFPAWPFDRWEHPWLTAGHRTWAGHGKLMMHRPGVKDAELFEELCVFLAGGRAGGG